MNLKKSLISIVLTSLIAGCSSHHSNYEAKLRNWTELRKAHEQVKKIEHVEYGIEIWNSPKKTLEKGYGHCGNIAILGAREAEPYGYEPKILILVDSLRGLKQHAVTLVEEKNFLKTRYGAFDKYFLLYPEYESIDSLIKEINVVYNRRYDYYAVLNLNLHRYWRTTEKNLLDFGKEKTIPLETVGNP